MGRKQTRAASSAAAAAHLSNTPSFTSFAAATAQALPTYSSMQPTPTATPWDDSALCILKRLSKRDTTTKQRALADLNDHLNNFSKDNHTEAGQTFVAAWEHAFQAALEDDAPTVRSAALSVMSLTVRTFRRLVQRIFPKTLPVLIAATGDLNPAVTNTAKKSLLEILPTAMNREKAASIYADNLREYVASSIARISPSEFHTIASGALAVLSWLLANAGTSDAIAPVIDDPANPLRFLARGMNRSTVNAAPQVCNLSIATLSDMRPNNSAHYARAERFADIVISVIRMREPAGWDLLITLFRSGWYQVFGDSFGKLPTAVCEAVAAPLPTGLHALLPLFDALPSTPNSSHFALSVLSRMRDALGITPAFGGTSHVSAPGSLSALPAFLEIALFVRTAGRERWFSGSNEQLVKFEEATFTDFVLPACCLFFRGLLPSEPKVPAKKGSNAPFAAKKANEGTSKKLARETAIQVAGLMRSLAVSRAKTAFRFFAKAFIESLDMPNPSEGLWRLEVVLDDIKDLACERYFSRVIIDELVQARVSSVESALHALAVVLSTRGSSTAVVDSSSFDDRLVLVTNVLTFARMALTILCERGKLKEANSLVTDLGKVCSWIYWAATLLNMEAPLKEIINALQLSCSTEEMYKILTMTIRAHKARESFNHVTSWNPICGKECDDIVIDALSFACNSQVASSASILVATAVDPGGGSYVSKEALNEITRKVIASVKGNMTSSALDGITTVLLGFPRYFSSSDLKGNFRVLSATSILRAPYDDDMMLALQTQLHESTRQDGLELANLMIDVLREAVLPSGQDQEASTYGKAIAEIMVLVGKGGLEHSVTLCEKFISNASPSFTAAFLRHIPFQFVFGDGISVPIRTDYLLAVIEEAYPRPCAGLIPDLGSFARNISADDRVRVTASVADHFVTSGKVIHKHVLRTLLSATYNHSQDSAVLNSISLKLHERITSSTKSMKDMEHIPEVILLCSALGKPAFPDGFRDLLEEAVRIVRKDALSSAAGVATDMLIASLAYPTNEHGRAKKLAWFYDITLRSLRAVRRFYEQSQNATENRHRHMDARAASLTSHAMKYFGYDMVGDDDIRFWTMKCTWTLRSFVEKYDNRDEICCREFKRLASVVCLSWELIRGGERNETSSTASSTLNEISHWAAWASVLLFPTLENDDEGESSSTFETKSVSRKSASELILNAGERGTLLTTKGGFPAKPIFLYRLVPYLASNFALSRKAVLTVLTHGASTDLQKVVLTSFPDEGFADEQKEICFVTERIPAELRAAISWQTNGDNPCAQRERDSRLFELGYFLAWRLFLDLVHFGEGISESRTVEAEEMSFRRVGVRYLRANPNVFAHFFDKCIEVVVDGSGTERLAAGLAASRALEAEERTAQGIQLAHRDRQKIFDNDDSWHNQKDDTDLEEAVGHAAGIAFARALQRLPALSRDHVMDRVDRGTSARVESFVRKKVSPLLIAAEIRKVKEWGAFGGGAVAQSSTAESSEGELHARGSVAGQEVWATYTFSDVTLEIGMRLPDTFPLQSVNVEARSRIGMSEARWRKTLLGMTTLLRAKDGTLAEAVELWRRNLDKTFQGAEECPICYSVLHLSTAALPKMQCRTCKNLFHSDCLCKWFTKSNSSACPLCRSAF